MNKKILAVMAHPDDESFGIGGTLAKYAREGVEIHVLCATRGESGQGGAAQTTQREQEIRKASHILGVTRVEFMGYIDGQLSNSIYHDMAGKIEKKIAAFAPDIVLTFERQGVSGHLDHIAVSFITTYVINKLKRKPKLYYFCELETLRRKLVRKFNGYFIYFPEGYTLEQIDVVIDVSAVWDIKVAAMKAHESQKADVKRILLLKAGLPKREYFIEAFRTGRRKQRTDFFDG